MRKLLQKVHSNRHFLLFILMFAYIKSIYTRIIVRKEIDAYIFTPEAAFATLISVSILFLIIVFFIKYWKKSTTFNAKEMLKIFISSLLAYLLVMMMMGIIIAFIFNTIERNFNRNTFILSNFSNLLDGFIYGSFFLAYYYYQQNSRNQKQSNAYKLALSESKIDQLKTQLNPHFLFNNLNILDQLIEEDKIKASNFLNQFAEIYRYVLQASDKRLIPLNEELIFAAQYFKLIQHKYGSAYQLVIENQNHNGRIAPLTLQLLIENAVQHNLGTTKRPIHIKIDANKNLTITNNNIPKLHGKSTSGRALNNLQEQYKFLTESPIEIQNSNHTFSVTIPIIHT